MKTIERCQRLYKKMKERNEIVNATVEQVLETALHTPDCQQRTDWPQMQRTLELFLSNNLIVEPEDESHPPSNHRVAPHSNYCPPHTPPHSSTNT